jgi:hypothetical protein
MPILEAKFEAMSILNNNKGKGGKKGKGDPKSNSQPGSKFITKPGKATGFAQKPHRSGGTRGS